MRRLRQFGLSEYNDRMTKSESSEAQKSSMLGLRSPLQAQVQELQCTNANTFTAIAGVATAPAGRRTGPVWVGPPPPNHRVFQGHAPRGEGEKQAPPKRISRFLSHPLTRPGGPAGALEPPTPRAKGYTQAFHYFLNFRRHVGLSQS